MNRVIALDPEPWSTLYALLGAGSPCRFREHTKGTRNSKTLHPTPYTLHIKNPTTCTLHPIPYTS